MVGSSGLSLNGRCPEHWNRENTRVVSTQGQAAVKQNDARRPFFSSVPGRRATGVLDLVCSLLVDTLFVASKNTARLSCGPTWERRCHTVTAGANMGRDRE